MSIDIQIGNNLQSRLKMITITSIYGDNVKEHFPLNSPSTEVVNEMSLIAENFKKQNRGNIQTKDSLYYYRTFVPKVSNEEGEQLFLLIYTDSKYPSSKIDKCFNEINKILSSPNAFAFSLLSKDTKNLINSIFFKYEDGSKIEKQVENKDNLIVGSIIIPNNIEAVKILFPLPPYITCINGTITTNPKKPYTIEGIPANKSMAGFNILCNQSGQKYAINTAHNIPIGTPMIIAPAVT